MKIVCTEAEYIALLDRFKTDVTVIEKGDERIYRGVNTLYGIPVEVKDSNTVRVVRCRDCLYFRALDGCPMAESGYFKNGKLIPHDTDFCSYGERRERD